MSYQDIYKNMVKQASAEQVKQLAGMIKKQKLIKSARFIVGPAGEAAKATFMQNIKDIGRRFAFNNPKTMKAVKIALPAVGGASALAASYGAGSAGKASLQNALNRANAASEKLTAENKALKKGSGSLWQDLMKALGLWWDRLSSAWNSGKDTAGQPKVPAAAAKV